MPGESDPKRDWVERVLGVRLGATGGPADEVVLRFRTARAAWQAALEAVDGQVQALAKVLSDSSDEDLREIGRSGLATVTEGFRARMQDGLTDLGDGDAGQLRKQGAKVAGFIGKLEAQIDGDDRVIACDSNDFGVAVSIRATLGKALERLAAVMTDAARTA